MKRSHLLFSLAIIISFSSCSKRLSPFTQNLYDDFGWNQSELSRIQFYLSEDIVLTRSLGSDRSEITEGQIRIVDGQRVEEIVFKKGTPGVCVLSPKSDRVGISFEEGGRENYLMFGPNKKLNGKYALLAKEWNRNWGKVSYKGKTYRTSYESAFATLLVDLRKAEDVKYSKTTVGGREVRG